MVLQFTDFQLYIIKQKQIQVRRNIRSSKVLRRAQEDWTVLGNFWKLNFFYQNSNNNKNKNFWLMLFTFSVCLFEFLLHIFILFILVLVVLYFPFNLCLSNYLSNIKLMIMWVLCALHNPTSAKQAGVCCGWSLLRKSTSMRN